LEYSLGTLHSFPSEAPVFVAFPSFLFLTSVRTSAAQVLNESACLGQPLQQTTSCAVDALIIIFPTQQFRLSSSPRLSPFGSILGHTFTMKNTSTTSLGMALLLVTSVRRLSTVLPTNPNTQQVVADAGMNLHNNNIALNVRGRRIEDLVYGIDRSQEKDARDVNAQRQGSSQGLGPILASDINTSNIGGDLANQLAAGIGQGAVPVDPNTNNIGGNLANQAAGVVGPQPATAVNAPGNAPPLPPAGLAPPAGEAIPPPPPAGLAPPPGEAPAGPLANEARPAPPAQLAPPPVLQPIGTGDLDTTNIGGDLANQIAGGGAKPIEQAQAEATGKDAGVAIEVKQTTIVLPNGQQIVTEIVQPKPQGQETAAPPAQTQAPAASPPAPPAEAQPTQAPEQAPVSSIAASKNATVCSLHLFKWYH
jgi:hypothetical protein